MTVEKLKCITELYDLTKVNEGDAGPSCSWYAAIQKQDLLINSSLANIGSKLLWRLFREGRTDWNGVFLNLDTMRMNPLKLK